MKFRKFQMYDKTKIRIIEFRKREVDMRGIRQLANIVGRRYGNDGLAIAGRTIIKLDHKRRLGSRTSYAAFARSLMIGGSVLAIAVGHPASAQTAAPIGTSDPSAVTSQDKDRATNADLGANEDDAAGTSGEIVVTGIRKSLATAQTIKREAATVVDAITASDIGSLPDRSINEALQRVPGVAITRFAAPNDSAHFSVQGSGVTIRGLNYVRSEFNGRDIFSASSGRGLGFDDVPAELAGSVNVYKNLTADMIEGGIAGTVSVNTRKPFDSDKRVLFFSAGLNGAISGKHQAAAGLACWSLAAIRNNSAVRIRSS
jgi:outer membrane receptor protein involved in Fe transport